MGRMSTAQRALFVLLGCVLAALPLGCGSGGGNGAAGGGGVLNPGNGAIAVTGVAFKGEVTGTITAFTIDPKTGAKVAQVAQAQTAAGGAFALSFAGVAGPVLLEATGTHRDEVTGQDLPIPAERPLVALFTAVLGDNSVSLSGLTSIHAAAALSSATSVETDVAQAIGNAAIALQEFYGIGDLFAAPAVGNAPDDGTKLLVLNGGFSQLGADAGVDPLAILQALARDFGEDRNFNGRDRGEIVFADGQPLDANAGTTGLVDAAQRASGQLAGSGVIQDAIDAIAGLFSSEPERQPRRRPSVASTMNNCGPLSGGTVFDIFGNFDGEFFDVTVDGRPVLVANLSAINRPDGTRIGIRIQMPPATSPGLVNVVIANSDGQFAFVPGGFRYKAAGEGAPSVDRSRGPNLVSKAGGTPVRMKGENLENADFVPADDDTVIDTDFQSGSKAQLPFPAQGTGSTLRSLNVNNREGSDFVEGVYADEPENQSAFQQKVAELEGTWCFFVALRLGDDDANLRFEFEFNDDGTGTSRQVFPNGTLGDPTIIEVEPGAGESLGIPIDLGILGEPFVEGSVANDGKLFLAAERGAVVIGLRKPKNFVAENIRDEYNAVAAVETPNTTSIFNGSFSFSEDRSSTTASVKRTLTGTGLETVVPAASGKADVTYNDDGSGRLSVPGMEDLTYRFQFCEGGDCFVAWFCYEDPECPFQGVTLGFGKPDDLETSDLGGNWAGICTTWTSGGGWSAGPSYGVGTLNSVEGKSASTTFSEFGEKIDEISGSPPLSTWFRTKGRELSLSPCGRISLEEEDEEGEFAGYRSTGIASEDGDTAVEVFGIVGPQILFGNNQAPFGISIRTRVPEFQSAETFTGDMNEIEFAIDNGFGADASDLTLRTRTVRQRTLSTSIRRLRTMGFFSETIDPVVKTVQRLDNGAPTVTSLAQIDNFDEVYTVVGDHMFVFPVVGRPGQNIEGQPPVIAQGRIAANGNFAVLQAPHERHGVMFRILAKKTTTAPDLAGMTYHIGCIGVVFDDEDDSDRLRYSRGTITFNADGTFDATIVEADEDPEGGITTFQQVNVSGAFTVEDDGRITITPDDGSPLKGMVTRGGNAFFLVNADGSTTDSEFCIAVKQATQVPAFQRTVLRRMTLTASAGFGGGSLFIQGGRADLIRNGTDYRVQQFDHVSSAGASAGRSERFFFGATSVLGADGKFDMTIGFSESRGCLSEDGVIGFLMQRTDLPGSNSIQVLVGR